MSISRLINKVLYIHTIMYTSTKKVTIAIHIKTWMNVKIITLSEKAREKVHTVLFHLYRIVQSANNSLGAKSRLVVA